MFLYHIDVFLSQVSIKKYLKKKKKKRMILDSVVQV